MRLFYVTEPIELLAKPRENVRPLWTAVQGLEQRNSNPQSTTEQKMGASALQRLHLQNPAAGRVTPDTLYFCTWSELNWLAQRLSAIGREKSLKLLVIGAARRLLEELRGPLCLGNAHVFRPDSGRLREQIEPLLSKRRARIAVINPFGSACGDSILFLAFLREIKERFASWSLVAETDLFQGAFNASLRSLYQNSEVFHGAHDLPSPLSYLLQYDAYFDFSEEQVRGDLPFIDGLLEAAAIDYASVPSANKRGRLAIEPSIAAELAPYIASVNQRAAPILFFHPEASTKIRSFPAHRVPAFLDILLELTDWVVVSASPIEYRHERFVDFSHLCSTFEHLTYLISRANMFLSVDTFIFHIAAAFDLPGVVLFTTRPPDGRLTYYPFIAAVELGENEPLSQRRFSERDRHSVWNTLDVERIRELLISMTGKQEAHGKTSQRAVGEIASVPCAPQSIEHFARNESEDAPKILLECPFCGQLSARFLPFFRQSAALSRWRVIGGGYRPNAICPGCFSLDRERLVYLYLRERTDIFDKSGQVLHVAPEPRLMRKLSACSKLKYTTLDLKCSWTMIRADITACPFSDNTFEWIICNHVLEHIPDDRKAMAELFRILKSPGVALLQVPISPVLTNSYEDIDIKTAVDRLEVFGQEDHVRVYGSDYMDRLRKVGFIVEAHGAVEEFGATAIQRHGLIGSESIYVCRRV